MNYWLFWVINVSAAPLLLWGESDLQPHEKTKLDTRFSPLRFDVRREIFNSTISNKREVAVITPIRQAERRLLIDFDLGTPRQSLVAELDLSNPGIYIAQFLSGIEYNTDVGYSISRGVYRRHESRTYSVQKGNLLTDERTWGVDDMYIGYQWFDRMKFLGISASRAKLGLGFLNGHHISTDARREDETNFFNQLRTKGLMHKYLFSLWIGGDDRDAKGTLILGAIDFRYAVNNFYLFPLLKGRKRDPGYYIELNGITVYQDGDYESRTVVMCSVMTQLDISLSVTTIPKDMLLALYGELGQLGIDPIMPCEMLQDYKIGFVFSGVEYLIPLLDIVSERFNNGEDCAAPFEVAPKITLGANVLSTLYMVFDVDNNEIALAFARTSKVIELGEHVVMWVNDTIPARHAPGYNKATVIRNIYEIKVRNINFTPVKVSLVTITKFLKTVTVTPECSTSTWVWGPRESHIMVREIG